jgi:predicted hydrolase (HD superfamily)
MNPMTDRETAWKVVCEFIQSESLRKHALAVEACVTAYARRVGENESLWSITALLHDFDWEIHPQAPDHPRVSRLEKTLYACDELAGFITAISYVKPHRSVFEVDVASVKKKMKDKAFARSVNRQEIVEGAEDLGVPLDDHIDFCIKAMQAKAEELGLKGSL